MRIQNIKEYKDVVETLYKIVSGATGSDGKKKDSPMFNALTPQHKKPEIAPIEEDDVSGLMASQVIESDG